MADDIVDDLRYCANIHSGRVRHGCIAEAADEIERLRTVISNYVTAEANYSLCQEDYYDDCSDAKEQWLKAEKALLAEHLLPGDGTDNTISL